MKNFEKRKKNTLKVLNRLYEWDIKQHTKAIAKWKKSKYWKAESNLKILNKELKKIRAAKKKLT